MKPKITPLFVNRGAAPGTGAGPRVHAGAGEVGSPDLLPEPSVAADDDGETVAVTMGELQKLIGDMVQKAIRRQLGKDAPREVIDAAGRRVTAHATNDPLVPPAAVVGVPSLREFTARLHDLTPGPLAPPRVLGEGGQRAERDSVARLNRVMAPRAGGAR